MENANFFDFFGQESPFSRTKYSNCARLFYSPDFIDKSVQKLEGIKMAASGAAIVSSNLKPEGHKTLKVIIIILVILGILFLLFKIWQIEQSRKEMQNRYSQSK
jgi:hypothetical protein